MRPRNFFKTHFLTLLYCIVYHFFLGRYQVARLPCHDRYKWRDMLAPIHGRKKTDKWGENALLKGVKQLHLYLVQTHLVEREFLRFHELLQLMMMVSVQVV